MATVILLHIIVSKYNEIEVTTIMFTQVDPLLS